MKQSVWETYFIASAIFLLSMLFFGTCGDSVPQGIWFTILLLISALNMGFCLFIGSKESR